MKTLLLLFGALLTSAPACESLDFLVQTLLTHAHHSEGLAQTSKTATPNKETVPTSPAKPAPQPTEKSKPAKPAPPPHLFM